jgi:menaquinone-dependent protoporphyrinogen oxidase
MRRVLVVYASRHGATAGIAERIGEVLRTEGLDVTVEDAALVPDPRGFDAYLIGSAAYMLKWEGAATSYAKRYADIIGAKPCWLFSSGPVGTELLDKKGNSVLRDPSTIAELTPVLHPRGTQVFFGAWDPSTPAASLAERVVRSLPAIKDALPTGDFRDWTAIDAWSRSVASEIKEPAPVA